MILQLKIAGVLLIALALLHAVFPRYFKWKESLSALNLVSREIMYIHTLFIAVTVLLMGLLCLSSSSLLLETVLGRRICIGLAFFWSLRLLVQFFGYSKELWLGKPFETMVHIVFTGLWLYLSSVFWIAGWPR